MVAKGNTTKEHDEKIAKMVFSSVYPHYLNKIVKNGRSEKELQEVITWLTGFEGMVLRDLIEGEVSFKEFFDRANLNPDASLIKGVICGYRIEDIETPLTQKCRYLDKLVDELAKGRKMGKILRAC
ncbi:MAG: DUF2200 domain-containing protein [Gammaproteobacteria bacterium]|nr:DUF2200 domain-containing protein [Gammaproteobacteria bacterium]